MEQPTKTVPPAKPPHHLRIFLASPGDVAEERQLALQVLEQLPYDPLLRGQVTLEAVAWDKPGAGAPLLATMTPQEAIAQGLPKPSECDIVIVILWSRLGTPLPEDWRKPDGSRYRSGTEWEYEDAVQAAPQGKPKVLLYRRTEKVLLDPDESEFEEKVRQWQEVKAFFTALRQPDGSLRGGWNDYATPAEFKDALNLHLRALIQPLLSEEQAAESNAAPGGGVTTSTIDTGGGAYIGGSVNIRGDFVGRDKIVTAGAGGVAVGGNVTGGAIVTGNGNVISQPQGATLEDLRALIAELGRLLSQAGLSADLKEVIEVDYQVVKKQAESDKPNGGIVKTKLKSMLELLTSSGNAAGAVEKILSIGTKAAQVAGLLFP